MLTRTTKSFLLVLFFTLGTIFWTGTLSAQKTIQAEKADVYLEWEKYKGAFKYNVKIMDSDGGVRQKIQKANRLIVELPKGKFKIKIGMIRTKDADIVTRETKWLSFKVKINKSLVPPKEVQCQVKVSTKSPGTMSGLITWRASGGSGETSTIYRIYKRDGDSYIATDKTGYVRIGKKLTGKEEISEYLVYKFIKKDYYVIGNTSRTQYKIDGLDSASAHTIAVRSRNKMKIKSFKTDVKCEIEKSLIGSFSRSTSTRYQPELRLGITPCFLLPIDSFAEISSMGFGALLYASLDNLIMKKLEFGIEAGYWYSGGKDEYSTLQMIPVLFTLNYNYRLTKTFRIAPILDVGANIIMFGKTNGGTTTLARPMVLAGLLTEKRFGGYSVRARAQFGALFDGPTVKEMALFSLSFGWIF
ncbi:MAG: hypothetical protein GY754_40460 [bacterium]|nr:hypothetical protein [bacterium]